MSVDVPVWQLANRELVDAGIDPSTVLTDGADETGYWRPILDSDGKKTLVDGVVARERAEWPVDVARLPNVLKWARIHESLPRA